MKNKNTVGHLLCVITVFIWGTTFISTKLLLQDFSPIEILFFRTALAIIALSIIQPFGIKNTNLKKELAFAFSGLCGVTLYFLLENIALTYTQASNVSVILSVAPMFTALVSHFFLKQEKLGFHFFIGFFAAILGIFIMSYSGSNQLQLNPRGDILAILAAFVWGFYSVCTKKISTFGYSTVVTTRRIFMYGLLFMIPAMIKMNFTWNLSRFKDPLHLGNILYLGLLASAACFVTWNYALKILGAIKTSVYIYLAPVVTIIFSVIILKEKITPLAALGSILAVLGLFISNWGAFKKKDVTK